MSEGGGVEVQVTNLDPGIDQRDIRQLISNLFEEYISIQGVNVYRQDGGGVGAIVKVGSFHDAQIAISQLHKRKVGTKRISISLLPVDGASLPRKEVVTLLQSVPGAQVQLFKFRQMFEERFRGSISVADLHKMKDIVSVTEDLTGVGRMVKLNTDEVVGTEEVEMLYCEVHDTAPSQTGWGVGRVRDGLPDVVIQLDVLSANIINILESHNGEVPLASLLHCYNYECSPKLQGISNEEGCHGVPLEHLLQVVKGVVVTTGSTGIKKIIEANSVNVKYSELIGPPPALAGQLIIFTREIVDMIKVLPGSKIPFYKFIPRYHHHFGKQCRVADYGFTKLRDLLESIPHVVQIIGEGSKTYITLAHKAQVRRFTNDLLKMLKLQSDKQFLLSAFSDVFEKCFFKAFRVYDYGVCFVEDILKDIPENTIITEDIDDGFTRDVRISIFRRNQTPEEVVRTRGFAKEVVELLRHSSELSICFNKFIPAYHQHFGRQCRVGSYGMTKLIELFEAITDTVEIIEEGEERIVQLTRDKMIWVVGEQVECVVKSSRARCVELANLDNEFHKMFGHTIPLARMGLGRVDELIKLLHSWIRIVHSKEGTMIVAIDRGFIRTVASNVRKLLLEEVDRMELKMFVDKMASRFGSHIEVEMLTRDLSYLVEVKDGMVGLTALQLCAQDIEVALGELGTLPVAELESKFEATFGRELPLEPLGFDSVSELLNSMSDTLTVRGRGIRKVVSVNKSASNSSLSPSRPSAILFPPPAQVRTGGNVAMFSGRGFDMLRTVTPHTVPRSYSGAVQATDFRQRSTQSFAPALPFSVPPPNYLSPLVVGSPQSSGQYSAIPIAAPNSPATPKTPMSFQYPTYPYYPAPMLGSPLSRSPVPTATFQQYMMQYRPSPLVIPPRSPTPYIVQPISRSVPIVGFDAYEQSNVLAASLRSRLNVDNSTPVGSIHTHNTFSGKCSSVNCYET